MGVLSRASSMRKLRSTLRSPDISETGTFNRPKDRMPFQIGRAISVSGKRLGPDHSPRPGASHEGQRTLKIGMQRALTIVPGGTTATTSEGRYDNDPHDAGTGAGPSLVRHGR